MTTSRSHGHVVAAEMVRSYTWLHKYKPLPDRVRLTVRLDGGGQIDVFLPRSVRGRANVGVTVERQEKPGFGIHGYRFVAYDRP